MALQDIITNLGTAIVNLVDRKILKHCEQIETVLLELKTKIDILVEESGSSSGGDTPVTPPDEPVTPELSNRVVYDETLGKNKVILTKEYLNKYIPDATFIEDLEIWIDSTYGLEHIRFGSNEAHYNVSGQESSVVDAILESITDSAGCLVSWNETTNAIDVTNSSTFKDYPNCVGLLLLAGTNTTDRDGTDLGSEDFSIEETLVVVPPTPTPNPST